MSDELTFDDMWHLLYGRPEEDGRVAMKRTEAAWGRLVEFSIEEREAFQRDAEAFQAKLAPDTLTESQLEFLDIVRSGDIWSS